MSKITNVCLIRSGTGCFSIRQQWALKCYTAVFSCLARHLYVYVSDRLSWLVICDESECSTVEEGRKTMWEVSYTLVSVLQQRWQPLLVLLIALKQVARTALVVYRSLSPPSSRPTNRHRASMLNADGSSNHCTPPSLHESLLLCVVLDGWPNN